MEIDITVFYPALTALGISIFLMPLMIWWAQKKNFTDDPAGRDEWRRLQKKPVANGGGIILFLAISIAILLFFPITKAVIAVLLAGLLLVVFGTLDDFRERPPLFQFLPHLIAAIIIVSVGIRINYITNPFDGTFDLTTLPWLPIILTILWIIGMINAVKFLDGVDGLSAGIGAIAAMVLGGLTMVVVAEDSITAGLAFTLAGGLIGYLLWNWHPAKIYYGEGGSTFLGFMIAVLAIFSGGKIATAFLVMGLPILDIARLIIVRLYQGKKPWQGGRDHLHHLLYDAGLGARGTVLVLYFISAAFGAAALFLQTQGKIIMAGVVFLVMLLLTIIFSKDKKQHWWQRWIN